MPKHRRHALALLALALAPATLSAQEVRVASSGGATRDTATHHEPDRFGGLLGIHGGAPAKLSAGIGLIYITPQDDSTEGNTRVDRDRRSSAPIRGVPRQLDRGVPSARPTLLTSL